jgi:Flp pilus assembly pilin Flp
MMKKPNLPVRARRSKGATTVEWVVLAMIIGVAMIAVWQQFKGKVADTLDNGGQKIEALKQ